MPDQVIKLKRSAKQNQAPTTSQLELGEVAINTYDGKMYIKKDNGTESIVEIGASSGSSGRSVTIDLHYGEKLSLGTSTHLNYVLAVLPHL